MGRERGACAKVFLPNAVLPPTWDQVVRARQPAVSMEGWGMLWIGRLFLAVSFGAVILALL